MYTMTQKKMKTLNLIYSDNYKTLVNYFEVQEWIRTHYAKYNSIFFENILPPVDKIILEPIIKKVGYLGMAYNTMPMKIRINFIYDMVEIEWKNVLLHEMIHIWQYTMGYSGGHGKTFKNKMREINKYGFGITCVYKKIIEDVKYVGDK